MGFHKALAGKDLHAPTNERIENNTGSTIPRFKAVSFNGFGTVFPQVTPGGTSVRGITQTDILATATGYITTYGLMTDLDTSAFLANDLLYSDLLGSLGTAVNGSAVAQVLKVSATIGVVYVFPSGVFSVGIVKTKAGRLLNSAFTGSPKKAAVTFVTAFPGIYAVNVTGVDSRGWTIESRTVNGFTINSNANQGLTGDVFWEALENGEF
jgi:hypothetical protein